MLKYKFYLHLSTSANILNPDNWVRGVLDSNTGNIHYSANATTTEFIPVSFPSLPYNIISDGIILRNSTVAFYDEDKKFISASTSVTSFNILENAKYIRVSIQLRSLENVAIGEALATFEPYWRNVNPIYGNSLALEYDKESDVKFFRKKLNGKLTFVGDDYNIISMTNFTTLFSLKLTKVTDSETLYWMGQFYKVDGATNYDDRTFVVQPSPCDDYIDILAHMEDEYDLIKLNAEISNITINKRSLIQIYIKGEEKITCLLSNMYWEQDCEAVDDGNDLVNTYHFAKFTQIIGTVPSGVEVYGRILTDARSIRGTSTDNIPADDMTSNTKNYTRVIGYNFPNQVAFWEGKSSKPTEWGLYQPNQYYTMPYYFGYPDVWYPIGRYHWGEYSIWYSFSTFDSVIEEESRQPYTLRDAYSLASVVKVLLRKISPKINHEATPEYSEFLYGDINPITGREMRLYITPKSNILAGNYTQSAQKSPITLKMLTNMLAQCFQCFWFIEDGKFRIEHIKFFKNGGSYTTPPSVGVDLTRLQNPRNGKAWSWGTSQITYDKTKLPGVYEFSWMDNVTTAFEGESIRCISPFVTEEQKEQVSVTNFTTDIDFMIANPNECSKDGYALINAIGGGDTIIEPMADFEALPLRINLPEDMPATDKLWLLQFSINGWSMVTISMGVDGGSEDVYAWQRFTSAVSSIRLPLRNRNGELYNYIHFRASSGSIKVLSFSRLAEIPIVRIPVPGSSTEYMQLQNGDLSFLRLVDFYRFNLPCYDVVINGERTIADGIARSKKQDVRIPIGEDEIDEKKLIHTDIGDGEIEKISINLSSRDAKVSLMFDTY